MLNLLLQLEDFLRKRINFDVLFVDLFCQSFELGGVSCFSGLWRRRLSRRSPKPKNQCPAENSCELHRAETLPLAELSGKAVRKIAIAPGTNVHLLIYL